MPKSDAQRHLALLQDYQDVVAGLGMIRDAIERAFDVALPAATTTKEEFEKIVQAIYAAAAQLRQASTGVAAAADKTTRTYFPFRVDIWTDDGASVLEHLAGVENLIVAQGAYRAACERWPNAAITLRKGASIVEDSRRGPIPRPENINNRAGDLK
jgi:hypothetical protein